MHKLPPRPRSPCPPQCPRPMPNFLRPATYLAFFQPAQSPNAPCPPGPAPVPSILPRLSLPLPLAKYQPTPPLMRSSVQVGNEPRSCRGTLSFSDERRHAAGEEPSAAEFEFSPIETRSSRPEMLLHNFNADEFVHAAEQPRSLLSENQQGCVRTNDAEPAGTGGPSRRSPATSDPAGAPSRPHSQLHA